MAFFIFINVIGLVLNLILYYRDITYNDSILDKVQDTGNDNQGEDEGAIANEPTADNISSSY